MSTFRILVVDDNPDHRFFIKRALSGVGADMSVDTVNDGEEALAFLRGELPFADRRRPHMVLLDLRMPRLSGLEVLQEMRKDETLRSVPVVVLTSSDRPEDVRDAYEAGTNSYVVKSGDVEGLRREIESLSEFWMGTSRVPEPSE